DQYEAGEKQVPYAMCPSNPWPANLAAATNTRSKTTADFAQACYGGSIRSQRAPSSSGACNPFNGFAQTFPGCSAGEVDYARSDKPSCVSGMFSYYGVFLRLRDVIDGTSNTLFVGELRPDCYTDAHAR